MRGEFGPLRRIGTLLALLLCVSLAWAQSQGPLSLGPWSDLEPHRAALRAAAGDVPGPVDGDAALAGLDQYRLEWRVRPGPGLLEGHQALRFHNRGEGALEVLELHLLPNLLGAQFLVEAARVDGTPVEPEVVDGWRLRLPLPVPLAAGRAAVAELDYRLELPEGDAPGYGLVARGAGLWALGHSFALRPPAERPSVRPSLQGDVAVAEAALYRLRLRLPERWRAAVTGSIVRDETAEGVRTLEVASGPARDLFALLGEAGVLQRIELPERPRVVGFAREDEVGGMREAMSHAVVALEALEALYGPYPYRELEVAPLETRALGVEFPGLILVSSSVLRERDPLTLTSTVVHEVAHQWFYNLVGSDQVLEPWVDEAISQYATLRVLRERYDEELAARFRRDLAQRWGRVGLEPQRIDQPVEAYGAGAYGPVVYGRGPLLLDALAERIGVARLDALLREHVAEHRFGFAEGEVLRERLEGACDCRLERLEPRLR